MTIYFDGAGFEAEKLCVNQFNGTLLSSKEYQYKDIDCFVTTKNNKQYTASVKDQRTSTKLGYDTIQLELELINTDNNKSIKGCFYNNESDYYFWLVQIKDVSYWCIVKSADLKKYVKENLGLLKTWQTTTKTENKNKQYGRYYNRSKGVMVDIETLKRLGELKKLK